MKPPMQASPSGRMRRLAQEVTVLLLLTILAGTATAILHPRAPGYSAGRVEAGAIHLAQVPDPVLWIDARERSEFEREHIPGAILLNQDEWEDLLPEFFAAWTPEVPVVVYCAVETCLSSKAVADRLRRELEGYGTFHYLIGGWEALKVAGK